MSMMTIQEITDTDPSPVGVMRDFFPVDSGAPAFLHGGLVIAVDAMGEVGRSQIAGFTIAIGPVPDTRTGMDIFECRGRMTP